MIAVTLFVVLAAAAAIGLAALVRGPSAADRMVALDFLLLDLAAGVALWAVVEEEPVYLVVLAVVSLVAFVGTVMVARIIEERGEVE